MTCDQQRFERDVASHEMTVIREDGVNRHLRFKKSGSSSYWFEILTWPNALCLHGDMGTYVFSRLTDMFEFFRTDQKRANEGELRINLGYWSEKLQAVDANSRKGSATQFSAEKFTRVINEYRLRWIRDGRDALTKEQRRELWEAVNDEVLRYIEDGEHAAYQHAQDFHWAAIPPGRHHTYVFEDLWEHNFEEYTFHFIWCCYAIAWAIRQYDAAKVESPAAVAA
ncbi:hypothetical protein [Cupriavidus basilensis]|uniref:hypothetical protein n=1 Tax=Cupriavidus basilensis TaxID=68895 RepID=UPI0028478175|nr:hypothetical protein [Cupriavidus basilensis]MDR3381770.1 hypothetical protein [Cupriavidus basilensis]